jgi:ADP-ribose pyrophosphatase YjhB (NUDIX family)
MQTQTVVSAGGVILDGAGRVVLTARRTFGGDLHWGLPKGQVEPGEAVSDAARREASEETGLQVEIVSSLPTIDYWYVDKTRSARIHKFVHYFLMRATGGDPAAHDTETEEVAVLDPNEALTRASFKSEQEVIRAAVKAGA